MHPRLSDSCTKCIWDPSRPFSLSEALFVSSLQHFWNVNRSEEAGSGGVLAESYLVKDQLELFIFFCAGWRKKILVSCSENSCLEIRSSPFPLIMGIAVLHSCNSLLMTTLSFQTAHFEPRLGILDKEAHNRNSTAALEKQTNLMWPSPNFYFPCH